MSTIDLSPLESRVIASTALAATLSLLQFRVQLNCADFNFKEEMGL